MIGVGGALASLNAATVACAWYAIFEADLICSQKRIMSLAKGAIGDAETDSIKRKAITATDMIQDVDGG